MEYSMQTDLCASHALQAAVDDVLALAASVTAAETLFVAKRTETGMCTLIVWGRERDGIRVGESLNLPHTPENGMTVPLPFADAEEQGMMGVLRGDEAGGFNAHDELALKRTASVIARLAESEQKSTSAKRENVLRKGRETAESSARHTGELLAMLGHEIRTPMNGMVAMSQLLKETALTEQQEQYLTIIEDSQRSLLQLVESILDYGKLESRQMQFETAPMDLIGALEDAAYPFAAKAAERADLELTLDLDLDPALILIGDVRKIRQVLSNLVSNAVKFTTAGEVRISARRLEGEGKERAWIEFCVQDTGIGISEAGISRLFHDYEQVHRSDEGDYGGTGLGLSISKRLVDLMGGKIWAKGRKGTGTSMTFVLPLEIDRIAGNGSESSKVTPLQGRRLLLAAKREGARVTLSRMAERLGLEVQSVASAEEAVSVLVREQPFDLVLSEWDIGGGIRDQESLVPKLSALPLVRLLPLAHEDEADASVRRTSFASLTKPVRQSELREVLVLACGGRVEREE